MLLRGRLRDAIARLNPALPLATREDARRQVQDLGSRPCWRPTLNGLPMVLVALRYPADLHADVRQAYEQIQPHKAQVPDVFQYNAVLVISDGTEALMGALVPALLLDYLRHFVLFEDDGGRVK